MPTSRNLDIASVLKFSKLYEQQEQPYRSLVNFHKPAKRKSETPLRLAKINDYSTFNVENKQSLKALKSLKQREESARDKF